MPALAAIPPGPHAGRVWHDAVVSQPALMRGSTVRQLTNYRGHSHHLVGAGPCWLAGGRQLVLVSDRDGCGNLFAYDFADASLIQLTDLRGSDRPADVAVAARDHLTFHYGADAYALDPASLWLRPLKGKAARPRVKRAVRSRLALGETMTADGRRVILVGSKRAPLVAMDGSGRKPFAVTAPSVSPDRRRVIFASDASGYTQVYAVDLPLAFAVG